MSSIKRSNFLLDSPYLSNRFDKLATSLIGQEQRRDERRDRIKKAIEEAYKAYKEVENGETKKKQSKRKRREPVHERSISERTVNSETGERERGEETKNDGGDRVRKG